MITTLACLTLMLPASAIEVGCQFDPPPVIEKALTKAYKASMSGPVMLPPDWLTYFVSNAASEAGTATTKTCKHGTPWPKLCLRCYIRPTPGDTIPPRVAAQFQETLSGLTTGVTTKKVQEENYEAQVKNSETLAALQIIESYLSKKDGPPDIRRFERSGGRAMEAILKKGGIGADMIHMAKYAINLSAKEGDVKWQNDPLWVYKVRQCVWSMRIGNSWLANGLVAAAVYQAPVKDTIPPLPRPFPR